MEKTCIKCGETKLVGEEFAKNRNARDGYRDTCRQCVLRSYVARCYLSHTIGISIPELEKHGELIDAYVQRSGLRQRIKYGKNL